MNLSDIIPVFKSVFENEEIEITAVTRAADIEEWDSINHIYLIVELEKVFKVKFSTLQIQSWTCVQDMIDDINRLQNAI